MNAAHWIAWIIVGWNVVGGVWEVVDDPVTRIWNSNFYLVCACALNIALLALSIAILVN